MPLLLKSCFGVVGFSHKLNSCAWRSVFESAFSIWSGTADRERLTISLTRRSKGRQGVPPGGAEQGSASRRRGMVPGECSYNFWWRLFLGVFPTADKSRGTRAGTVGNNIIRKARVLFRNYSCPSIVSSILATNSLGCISKAPAIFQIVSKFACFVPFSIMDKCVRAIPANPLNTS